MRTPRFTYAIGWAATMVLAFGAGCTGSNGPGGSGASDTGSNGPGGNGASDTGSNGPGGNGASDTGAHKMSFPSIAIFINKVALPEKDEEVSFGNALQTSIMKHVNVINPGTRDLIITGIDWAKDATTGIEKKNAYVTLDLTGIVKAFPVKLLAGDHFGITFKVAYTPPVGHALDDFSPSDMVITSNARTQDGSKSEPQVHILFTMPQHIAVPRVAPTSFEFDNAAPTAPETQQFTISNDPQTANAPFKVISIKLDKAPSKVFKLLNLPNLPAPVLAPRATGYKPVAFSVRYQPEPGSQGTDTNTVLVTTDVAPDQPIRIPLSSASIPGSYSLSYSVPTQKFDFQNVHQKLKRSVLITSGGPGPLTFGAPSIDPSRAKKAFTFKAFIPGATSSDADKEISSWPRAFAKGRSVRFDVTYAPPSSGTSPNGHLLIPIRLPAPETLALPLYSGKPKSFIVLAPATGNVSVNAKASAGGKGIRHVVIYNEGNGDLKISSLGIFDKFGTPAAPATALFTLQNAPKTPLTVAPNDLLVLELGWDISKLDGTKRDLESLHVTYYDPYVKRDADKTMGLVMQDQGDKIPPTASAKVAGDATSIKTGDTVVLDGSASTPGSFGFTNASYVWYVITKPSGSAVALSEVGPARASFTPDKVGAYSFELVTYTTSTTGSLSLDSKPAVVTVTVVAGGH